MNDEIDLAITDTLASFGHDFVDGIIIESEHAFPLFISQAIQRILPQHKIEVDADGVLMCTGDWNFTIPLAKARGKMKPFAPGKNRDLIAELLERLIKERDTWVEVREVAESNRPDWNKLALIPKFGSEVRKVHTETDGNGQFLSRPAIDYVHSVPVIDKPSHFMFLPRFSLPELDLTEDEIYERALQNTRQKSQNIHVDFEDGEVATITDDDVGGTASQLLFDNEFWAALSRKVEDDLFIHVVEHNQLIVCKASARAAIFDIMTDAALGRLPSLMRATFFAYDDKGLRLFAKMLPDDA